MALFKAAGVPALFQFEGRRFAVTDLFCLDSDLSAEQGVYSCTFIPKSIALTTTCVCPCA